MNPRVINYYQSYAFADLARSVVRNPDHCGFPRDVLPDFFDFRTEFFFDCVRKPRKYTLLHSFTFGVNYEVYEYMLRKVGPEDYLRPCKALLGSAQIPVPDWLNENYTEPHKQDLEQLVEKSCEIVANNTFQLLFSDRTFLFEFNQMIAESVATLEAGEHSCVVANGEIARETYFPVWLKDAVFHRDKGRCQLCGYDLTNILVPTSQRHFDHMVPLKAHGTNDPTNIQLVCETCNKSKGKCVLATDHWTYTYW